MFFYGILRNANFFSNFALRKPIDTAHCKDEPGFLGKLPNSFGQAKELLPVNDLPLRRGNVRHNLQLLDICDGSNRNDFHQPHAVHQHRAGGLKGISLGIADMLNTLCL